MLFEFQYKRKPSR